MRKIFLFMLAIIAFMSCSDVNEQEILSAYEESVLLSRSGDGSSVNYYWCDGEKIPLTLNVNKLFVLIETEKYESIRKSAVNIASQMINVGTMNDYSSLNVYMLGKDTTIRSNHTSFTLDNANEKTIDIQNVVYVAPYFKTRDGVDLGITNVLEVRLKDEQDLAKLETLAKQYKLEILGKNKFDRSLYFLSCTKESRGNSLEMANLLYESGAFEYASPEFLIESRAATDDQYYGYQWGLKNTSYPSFDINYEDAMTVSSFSNIGNIIVAVVDNGVYSGHPDLSLHNVSYNAHTGGSTSELYGDHGTKCAGVIGAKKNNVIGIAGVASGVKIMPISIVYTADGARLGIPASTTTHFANAIRFAANNGAHVINNSWSFTTSSPIPNINDAISYAQKSGRNGKGCVVVFSSGNESGVISQPAAGIAETLVVGAISQFGERSSFSNYGSQLDIVAPGYSIWTTTETGGYGPFNGTSFAAPHVSGVAALVLSLNSNYTQKDVANIIEKTARKLPNHPPTTTMANGSWNNEVGYGLVDAYLALGNFSIIGKDEIWAGASSVYSIPTLPSQYQNSIVWSCTSDDVYSSYYTFNPQTAQLSIVDHEGGVRSSGTFTITAEVPQQNWKFTKTVKCLKLYIDGMISVPNEGRMPFFAVSNGDISGMILYIPAQAIADISITYPDFMGFMDSGTYLSARVNKSTNSSFGGSGRTYSLSPNAKGSELDVDILFNQPLYPNMQYKFKVYGSNSSYTVGITNDYIVIPQQQNKTKGLDQINYLTMGLRYEIRSGLSEAKEIEGIIATSSVAEEGANIIDISTLNAGHHHFVLYKGGEPVFSENFEKR